MFAWIKSFVDLAAFHFIEVDFNGPRSLFEPKQVDGVFQLASLSFPKKFILV